MFARYYKDLHIHVTHGDITTRDGITKENILESNVNEVESNAVNSHLTKELFSAVIHIMDTDGAYVDNAHVVEDLTKDEVFYLPTEMRTKDKHGIEKRNLQKRENLNRMIGKKGLWSIPYNVYYMSCNLDQVLHNKKNSNDEEKEQDAYDFAECYRNKLLDFLEFIADAAFYVPGSYIETWKFIKKNLHSLERHTNLGLCFKVIP